MDGISVQINFKGKSGRMYSFVYCYDLMNESIPGSEGIYVFTKERKSESGSVLDVQLLFPGETDDTITRMKEDGALFAFFKKCSDELSCDAEIDDIKGGEDYRKSIE